MKAALYRLAFICDARHAHKRLRRRLYGEKLSRVHGSPAYPSYPGRANFSYISLQNTANCLHEKKKREVGSTRRVHDPPSWATFFISCRPPSKPSQLFFHVNTLARQAGSTRSKQDNNENMRERCCHWGKIAASS